jgi:hypothetical protein
MQCLDLNQQRGDKKQPDDASRPGGGAMWCKTHFRLCKGICAKTERQHCRGDQHTLRVHVPKAGAHTMHGSHAPTKHASTTPPLKIGTVNTCTRASKSATGVGSRGCPTAPRHATFGHFRAEQHEAQYSYLGHVGVYKVARNSHHGYPST